MSNGLLYWILMGVNFIVTLGVGVLLMSRTKKFGLALGVSTLLNIGFTVGSILWLRTVDDVLFAVKFGVIVYGIAFVNALVFDLFILMSLKNKGNGPSRPAMPRYDIREDDDVDAIPSSKA
ncbi:hypothetical protein NV379_14305 [Paenibacillus sp. N1-5-1-14]|uniref:hypothetical protein n=1 Tax=Paenibacillus radicibacter TaxID=2972488 RepID=UPI002159926D|nr:hypothetical protein [Paenibacillus radicibacter]MCR8643824.1 hypothetical protein [Paenibacillus radicibacter]